MKKKVELQSSYREPFSDLLNQHSHPAAHDLWFPYFHAPLSQAVALGSPAGVCLVTADTLGDTQVRDGTLGSGHC